MSSDVEVPLTRRELDCANGCHRSEILGALAVHAQHARAES
jgi:hypothetical protein